MRTLSMLAVGAGCLLTSSYAHAHVSAVVTTPAVANANYEATLLIPHGCGKLDTSSVTIKIPAGATGVRAVHNSLFSSVTFQRDAATNVTAITFAKPDASLLPDDSQTYKLGIALKLPDAPFTTVYLPATQNCKSPDGTQTDVRYWTVQGAGDTSQPTGAEASPALFLYPARTPGWNKWKTPAGVKITELAKVFKDAEIVWSGDAAYSINPNTAELISKEPDTEVLAEIAANTEFWVKY